MSGRERFHEIYELQRAYQESIVTGEIQDSVHWFMYHIVALQEEVGEFLKTDKRWKTHRNIHYNRDKKLKEYADVFITILNLGLFSGFTYEEVLNSVYSKIEGNFDKIDRM